MNASGYIFRTKHRDVSYYYKPTTEKWVIDIKLVSIGDIYFQTLAAKLFIGSNKEPNKEDFPILDQPFE